MYSFLLFIEQLHWKLCRFVGVILFWDILLFGFVDQVIASFMYVISIEFFIDCVGLLFYEQVFVNF